MVYHIERVNSLIRQEISELLRLEVKDPRLGGLITVTAVSSSPDMRRARVYVSSLGGREDRQETLEALASAAGFLRSRLAKQVRLRRIPDLIFEWDDSIERGDQVLRLIEKVSTEEAGADGAAGPRS